MSDKPGRFDDWQDVVDCHDCHHYWSDTCDGVPVDKRRNCQSFVATRNSDIPKRLSKLEDTVRGNRVIMALIIVELIVMIVVMFRGGVL